MLRVGKAKADVWPKTAPKKDENTLGPPAPVDSDGESDNSDRVPVPSFQNSFSQAIEAAFMKLDTPVTSDPLSEEKGGKKRKKQKRRLKKELKRKIQKSQRQKKRLPLTRK